MLEASSAAAYRPRTSCLRRAGAPGAARGHLAFSALGQ